MITLNGKQFAEKGEARTDATVGTAQRFKRQIKLFNLSGELIGVINRLGCLLRASLMDGQYWYSFATIPEIGKYDSYLKSQEEIEQLCKRQEYRHDGEVERWYK